MNIRAWFVLIAAMSLSSACRTAATPTPQGPLEYIYAPTLESGTSTASTTSQPGAPTPDVPLLPAKVGDNSAPPSVPACSGIQNLVEPFNLPWDKWDPTKEDRVIKHAQWNNWTYYHCDQSVPAVSAFYRQSMLLPQFNWFEESFEERPEGTLAIYNNSNSSPIAGYRWIYLMFIPDPSAAQTARMAVVWWDAPYTC